MTRRRDSSHRLAGSPVIGNLTAAVLVALLFVRQGDILFVATAVLLVCHLAVSGSATTRLLEWRPIYYLGVISYSIYLVHLIAIYAMRHVFSSHGWSLTVANLTAILLSLLLAPIAYHLIEVPGRMAIRHLLSVRRIPAATAP